jgi:arylsulfatase A-like enzyme
MRSPTSIAVPLVLLGVVSACRQPPAQEPRNVEVVRHVLAAGAVAGGDPPPRAVAAIGDEARSVLAAPAMVHAAESRNAKLVDGKVRVRVELSPEARELPDSAFVLSMQTIPADVVAALPNLANSFEDSAFRSVEAGEFTIARDPDDRGHATIELAPARPLESTVVNIRLHALAAAATDVSTDEFEAPAGARLELGFGLAQPAGSSSKPRVRFVASLSCRDSAEVELVHATVDGGEPDARRWHDVTHDLPAGKRCRLRLAAGSLTDDAVRGAVWSVPRIVTPATESGERPQSVVIVCLDTLRADHVSGYGYERATSPEIDARMIARGTTFVDASTTFPRTNVAHMSLFTSAYPEAQPRRGFLAADSPVRTLAEALRRSGFETAAFTEDALVAGSFGFWFGFDRFVEREFHLRDRGVETFADAARYVHDNRDRRFFLFVHTYKTHDPYVAGEASLARVAGPGAIEPESRRRIPDRFRADFDAYDATIVEADALLGGFLDELERSGLAERTLVILLSDHGEAFGEHQVANHGLAFHQEQMRVPLVFRGPGVPAGETVRTPVSLVDVAPTILDVLGLEPLPHAQGSSLAPAFAGGELPGDRPLFFSWLGPDHRIGMRLGDLKLISIARDRTLFDLREDPDETSPRRPSPEQLATLLPHVERYLAESERKRLAATPAGGGKDAAPIDPRIEESLRALGYL